MSNVATIKPVQFGYCLKCHVCLRLSIAAKRCTVCLGKLTPCK